MAGQDRVRLSALAVVLHLPIVCAGLNRLAAASSFRRDFIFAATEAPAYGLWLWYQAFGAKLFGPPRLYMPRAKTK